MGKYEVTQRQWTAVTGNYTARFAGCADCPVEQVSWNGIQAYLNKLNTQTGQHYRLPTEAEWEYACRGGVEGQRYCGGNDLDRLGWYQENSGDKTHPVGQKAPNSFGLYDMSGNVWEWTCSEYDKDYSGAEQQCTNNYTSATTVVRGGAYNTFDTGGRSGGSRFRDDPRNLILGFRLVRDLYIAESKPF